MNTTDHPYERIDAYLDGTLSETEKAAFETAMAASPQLAEEVETQRLVHALILESSLGDIRRQVGKDLGTKQHGYGKTIALTVGCILIAGTLYWWSASSDEKTPSVRSKTDTIIRSHEVMENKAEAPGIQKKKNTVVSESQIRKQTGAYKALSAPADEIPLQKQHLSVDTAGAGDVVNKGAQINKAAQTGHAVKEQTSVPCPDILFSIHTEPSCNNSHSGSVQILLSSILGGQPPYRYSIDGREHSLLTDLAAGTYTVTVVDSRGCNMEEQARVLEKKCTIFKDYSFNPETETWKLPFSDLESGTISILDQSGTVVYKSAVTNGQPYEWNGRSMNGSILKTGSYLYIATSADGETRQGYIILLH